MSTSSLPLVAELPASLSAVEAFRRLSHLPHIAFFDSAAGFGTLGRYSFVAADPFDWLELSIDGSDVLADVASKAPKFTCGTVPDLPPFQGGIAGLLSFELNRSLEHLPGPRFADFPIPALAVGFYDVVLAFDHQQQRAWIFSQGFPASEPAARGRQAAARLARFQGMLGSSSHGGRKPDLPRIPIDALAPQFDVGLGDVTSNLTSAAYQQMVRRAVDYIHAGDVFQVNLAQRLLAPAMCDSTSLYLNLRERNPAPYAGYFDLGDWQIISSSPECFLRLRNGIVETRPIKGTRGRSMFPEADLYAGDDLQQSEKDRAENVMIVDLMRNDLSRVCTPESVEVSELFRVETYAHVKHLVSAVLGKLAHGCDAFDLLRACFPGGSITGAPKIRAMEIIAELEPTARGAYCGSLFYLSCSGQMDSSILIRTITAGGGWWQLPVGGGIVAQSDPLDEYRETWHKARGLLHALNLC